MGRVAVEILPPLARDEGGTAFRVKDDSILSQDARARIFDVKTASHRGLSELLVGKPFFRFDLQIPRLAPCVSRWNAGLPSSRGARSANGALLSRFMGRRPSPWAALWSAVSGRFAVAGEARLCPCMLPSASGLRIPRLARGLFTGVFSRPVGRVGGKFLRAGRLRAANGALGFARRPVLGIAAERGLPLAMGAAAERGLAALARGAVGEGRVVLTVHGTAVFAVRVTAERGFAVLARCAAGGGSLSRLKRGGFREGCRLRRAYEFRGLRGGFLRVFSHGR